MIKPQSLVYENSLRRGQLVMGRRTSLSTSFYIDVVVSSPAVAEPLYGRRKDGNDFFAEKASNLSIFNRNFLARRE